MRGKNAGSALNAPTDTAGARVTVPPTPRWRPAAVLWLPAGIVAALVGCAQFPVSGTPAEGSADTPPATVPNEASSGVERSVPDDATDPSGAPTAEPARQEPPARPAELEIAVGAEARASQYASLAGGQHALASRELGYFIDVHEARLRQALTGTPVRMERSDGRLRLTVPGSLSFGPGSAEILEDARPVLVGIAAVLAEFDKTLVSVHGHTDRSGDSDYNRVLSERRAVAVAQFLARHGVARQRLVGIGHGEEQPAVDGDSEEARAANRRIEILIEPIVTGTKVANVVR